MQAVVFDWLDKTVNDPERLPRHDVGENLAPTSSRYARSSEARRADRRLAGHAEAGLDDQRRVVGVEFRHSVEILGRDGAIGGLDEGP